MSKKIIALLVIATVVFMCVFAACDKGTYTNPATGEKYKLVTDEDGQKVLNEDGELLVFVTDEHGRTVTNENGEALTEVHGFIGQLEENGIIEDYAYKLLLPEGWKADKDNFGDFENKAKKQSCSIDILEKTYAEYYKTNQEVYQQLSQDSTLKVTWEEEVVLRKGAEKVCRFTMEKDDSVSVMYFYENSGNLYKVLFVAEECADPETALKDAEDFAKSISYKPYTYYPDLEVE